MIYYDLGKRVEASSTCIGEERHLTDITTPEYQAHSTKVAVIPDQIDATYGVDALITDTAGIRIGVRTADCVPILIHDCRAHAAAAIHSGWKGTAHGIIYKVIEAMQEHFGCNTADMKAVIGPCIHIEAFEVGDEVYDEFACKGYEKFCVRMANPYNLNPKVKWHIDLPGICHSQLSQMNVPEIYTSPYCTYRQHDMLYSYRHSKSNDPTHRIFTSIMLK